MISILLLLFLGSIKCTSNDTSVFKTEDFGGIAAMELAIKNFIPESVRRISVYSLVNELFWSILTEKPKILPNSIVGNEEEAKRLLRYASVAYCPLKTVADWKCNTCDGSTRGTSDVVLFNNDTSRTYAYLAVNHSQEIIVISFRGTDGLGDWMGNFKVYMTSLKLPPPYQGAKVHGGFNSFVDGIANDLRYALSNAMRMNPSYTVKFVGHSKGGALASIAAVKMVQYGVVGWNKVSIYTYGQPRTGNAEFANYINSQPVTVLRVTAYADMATVVPEILQSYQHFQYNLHMTSEGKTFLCDKFAEDPRCTNDFMIASLDAHYTYFNLRINSACN